MDAPVTLKLNKEFKRAYYRGRYKAGPLLVIYAVPNGRRGLRYGITTGKKVGNAVKRSRARRVIRAAFAQLYRENELALFEHMDLVLVARERTPHVKSTEVYAAMKRQLAALSRK